MKNKKFKSDVFESIHESATALAQVGGLDKTTMKGFDEACLVKTPQNKTRQIKQIRERVKVIQSVFAIYLNTSKSTLQK